MSAKVHRGGWPRRGLLRAAPAALLGARCADAPPPLTRDTGLAVPEALASDVAWIEASDRDTAQAQALERIAGGADPKTLRAALLVACCRQSPLRRLGHFAHPMWSLAPAWHMGQGGGASGGQGGGQGDHRALEALAFLQSLDRLKQAQESVDNRSRPTVPSVGEDATLPPADEALEVLRRAFVDWDARAADDALLALGRQGRAAEARSLVLRFGCRSLTAIGHAQVHTSQLVRALDLAEVPEATTLVLRALVFGLLGERRPDLDVHFAAAETTAAGMPPGWDKGADSAEAAWTLARMLRSADVSTAVAATRALLDPGSVRTASPRSVWTGLGLAATELALRRGDPSGTFPAFHTVTGVNGFHWIYDNTDDPLVRCVALLQAAALVVVNRDEARRRAEHGPRAVSLDALPTAPPPRTLDELWSEVSADRPAAASRARAWFAAGGTLDAFASHMNALMLRKADEDHHVKLPRAAYEEARAALPTEGSLIALASLAWGKTGTSPDWRFYARVRARLG